MSVFYNIMLGYFFGFALGVGCALAVFYAIYSGGYRKAIEHRTTVITGMMMAKSIQ